LSFVAIGRCTCAHQQWDCKRHQRLSLVIRQLMFIVVKHSVFSFGHTHFIETLAKAPCTQPCCCCHSLLLIQSFICNSSWFNSFTLWHHSTNSS
jgi:hypothetical protein